ncbi:DUF3108 domain-containing protein [Mariniflexile ostreae]|uniref:DUF3108 domain-containing protein n=1 Tax=Mariniflexile ostreae TaxID=1520892 RepID=A0ABV5FBF2_9FLAO
MKWILFFSILWIVTSASSQNNAIVSGEKLTYTASYNMSGILTNIAEITMETSTVKTSKATLLRLKCTAATYTKWDNLFKIRDLYESYVAFNALTPYLYKRDVNEGKYSKFMQYTFNPKTNTVKSIQRKKNKQELTKNLIIKPGTKDIVTALYNIRLFDYKNMPVGTRKSFVILFDNKENHAKITYLGKETISTALGSKLCYKLAVGSQNDVLKGGSNSNLLWLTADENKIIVYGKFNIPVGNGELKIKSATGLKH